MKLTAEGKRIAQTRRNHVEVIAGPGCGKTTVIAERCKYLMSKGQDAGGILVLSFSNESTKNLRQRLARVAGGADVEVKTCHAFSSHLVRNNLKAAGRTTMPVLYSDPERLAALCKARNETRKVLERQRRLTAFDERQDLSNAITWLNDLPKQRVEATADLFEYARASRKSLLTLVRQAEHKWVRPHLEALKVWRAQYRALKRRTNRIDYGDLIRLATKVLKAEQKVRGVDYDHLLVDEYQDTSPAQAMLFRGLAIRIPSLMVVGDPRQTVFGFGGAAYTPFSELVSDVTVMPLSVSHRLTQATADFANAVYSTGPIGRKNRSPDIVGRAGGKRPLLFRMASEQHQAETVVNHISKLLASGVPTSEIVVLSRHKASLKPVQRQLASFSIKSQRSGQVTDLVHVARVLKLAAFIDQGKDSDPVANGMAAIANKVSGANTAAIRRELANACKSSSLEGRYRGCAKAYMIALGGIRHDPDIRAWLDLWTPLCRQHLTADLMRMAIKGFGAAGALETSTIHGAKGREWRYVFVIGVADNVLPDYRSTSAEKLSEERNLLFVAITRASERVTLSYAPQTITGSERQKSVDAQKLCRFLDHPAVKARLDTKVVVHLNKRPN